MKKNIVLFLFSLSFCFGAGADVSRFDCEYPIYSDKTGHNQRQEDLFELEIVLDRNEGKAYLTGVLGIEEVTYLPNIGGSNFIEVTDTGNISTTTITDLLESVHSRNTVVRGKLIATQYYGKCSVR